MSATVNAPIRYRDLIDISYANIITIGKNVEAYDASVPAELKYPYSWTYGIPVQTGFTPHVTWTNNAICGVVPLATLTTQFNDFCNNYLFTNNAHKDKEITLSEAMRFLSAIFCFIQSKFFVVYSHLTSATSIFYRSDLPVDYSKVVVIEPFRLNPGTLQHTINCLCASALTYTSTFCATETYTLSPS